MTWSYRVFVRHRDPIGPGAEPTSEYFFGEAYYDGDGKVTSWTAEPCWPGGETLDELRADVALMKMAFHRDVLDLDELEAQHDRT